MTKKEREKCVITWKKKNEYSKKEDNKRNKAKRDNLDDNEKQQMKKEHNKRKKAKSDNLGDNEKE